MQKIFKGAFVNCSSPYARLQWARAHQDWLLPQWRNVLSSDESRFGLVSGTMIGTYYLQNIINDIVQPLRNEIGDQFIFMDDNARPHCTRALENENVWDYVSRAIFNQNNPPRSTQELIVAATRNGTIFHRK
nr:unnamed protein product [Callosobruchus chinensis]